MTVRQAIPSDLEQVASLFDAYRQFYRKPSDLALAKEFIRDRIQNNESIILVAIEQGSEVLGFTQLYPSFSSGAAARILILNDLFVVSHARRRGIGRALLQAAADYGKATGAIRLSLSTEVTNLSAQSLYESEGWQRQTGYYVYTLGL